MLDLLSIGEVMAELRQDDDGCGFVVGYAGDSFNTAIYCARTLEDGGKVGYATRVGTDPLSKQLLTFAQQETLDCAHIEVDPTNPIGIHAVSTDEHGERSFSYWRSQSAARQMFSSQQDIEALPSARIVYVSGISLAILSVEARARLMDHLQSLSQNGTCLIAFDSNYRPQLWEDKETARNTIFRMWEVADIALPSIDDEMALFDDRDEDAVLTRFANGAWKACAVKRGERGPISPQLSLDAHPTFRAQDRVVDTTAAGDSFNGAYLAGLLQEEPEETCLEMAHNTASSVVGIRGAITPRRMMSREGAVD